MKKVLSVVSIILLIVALAGCSDSLQQGYDDATTSQSESIEA